jgi:GNAT superfamily N-acetyltransferase
MTPQIREATTDDSDAVLGTANMYANRAGPGAHVASASFMVASTAQGRGVGRALVEDALTWARAAGFRTTHFNALRRSGIGFGDGRRRYVARSDSVGSTRAARVAG